MTLVKTLEGYYMGEVLYLSKEEIKKCTNIKEAINAVEEGIKALARNEAV